MQLVYLDNNATTKPAPEVVEAMLPFLTEWYGNASSVHRFGQRSRQAIDEARSQVASLIGCDDAELAFTSGGTESINTALRVASGRKKLTIIRCRFTVNEFIATTSPSEAPANAARAGAARS